MAVPEDDLLSDELDPDESGLGEEGLGDGEGDGFDVEDGELLGVEEPGGEPEVEGSDGFPDDSAGEESSGEGPGE